MQSVVTLFRPTGPRELELVAANGFRRWPPRLPEQPIFYPVTNEAYARAIAERWNVKESGSGFVTQFAVKQAFLDRYARQVVGAREHEEYWIPAEDLEAFNDAIVGRIEVTFASGDMPLGSQIRALPLPQGRIEFCGERPAMPDDLGKLDMVATALFAATVVSSISQDYWCAGWLLGIGAQSYQWTHATGPVECGLSTLDDGDRAALTRLRARLEPWWVEWVSELGGVAIVSASNLPSR